MTQRAGAHWENGRANTCEPGCVGDLVTLVRHSGISVLHVQLPAAAFTGLRFSLAAFFRPLLNVE